MCKTIKSTELSNLSLIIQSCECGEMTILGFPHQIKWKRINDKEIKPDVTCPKCGRDYPKGFLHEKGRTS